MSYVIGVVGTNEAERCILHYSLMYMELVGAEILAKTEPGRIYSAPEIKMAISPMPVGPWFHKLLRSRAFVKRGRNKYLRIDLQNSVPIGDYSRREYRMMENLCRTRVSNGLY